MYKFISLICGAVMLTGCTGFTPVFQSSLPKALQTTEWQFLEACRGFKQGLSIANDLYPLMSEPQKSVVDVAVEIVPPLCRDGEKASLEGKSFNWENGLGRVSKFLSKVIETNGEI